MPSATATLPIPASAPPTASGAACEPISKPNDSTDFADHLQVADDAAAEQSPGTDGSTPTDTDPTQEPVAADPTVTAALAALVLPAVLPLVQPPVDPLADLDRSETAALLAPGTSSIQTLLPSGMPAPATAGDLLGQTGEAATAPTSALPTATAATPNPLTQGEAPSTGSSASDAAALASLAPSVVAPTATTAADADESQDDQAPSAAPTDIDLDGLAARSQPAMAPVPAAPAPEADAVQAPDTDASAITAAPPRTADLASSPRQDIAPTATTSTRPQAEPNPAERALANQVVRAVLRHDAEGGRSLVLRLTPPELGTVRVEIVERAGTLSARISSDDQGVRNALERALPLMRQELRGSDAPVRDVSLADTWFGDAARRGRNGHESSGRRQRDDGDATFSVDGLPPAAAAALPIHRLGGLVADGRVDARA